MPISKQLIKFFPQYVGYKDINGFPAWETAEELNVIEDYVLTINEECINWP